MEREREYGGLDRSMKWMKMMKRTRRSRINHSLYINILAFIRDTATTDQYCCTTVKEGFIRRVGR